MQLEILLPSSVFVAQAGVRRIVAETPAGAFGLLPHRLDCVTAIAPGILTYETSAGDEVYVATDAGVLVKTGGDVRVSVRRAIAGTDLGALREAVTAAFLTLDAHELRVRSAMARLETGLLRRFVSFKHV